MDDVLFFCGFRDLSSNGEIIPELLSAMEYDFSSWRDAETGILTHTLYFKTEKEAEAAEKHIGSLLPDWNSMELKIDDLHTGKIKKEDWAESWKIHFHPIEISERLAVTPSWIDFPARAGQKVIMLDPGMSFGTGQHATTKFCLTRLDLFASENDVSSMNMLDAGCGSGILAIAAEKLGFGSITAFDIDPEAARIAEENARANGCSRTLFSAASLIEFNSDGVKYDVIAANILSSALLAGRDKLLSLLKPGGTLILAGILDKEYSTVAGAFGEGGCVQFASAEEKQWRGGAFRFKHRDPSGTV